MADGRPDIQPTPLVSNHVEEVQRHDVADGHDDHEERRRRDAQAVVEDSEIRADHGERDEDLENEQGALREGVKDGDQARDAVEGEGGNGGDVAGAEEGGLEEEEEEEGDAGVGEG